MKNNYDITFKSGKEVTKYFTVGQLKSYCQHGNDIQKVTCNGKELKKEEYTC